MAKSIDRAINDTFRSLTSSGETKRKKKGAQANARERQVEKRIKRLVRGVERSRMRQSKT